MVEGRNKVQQAIILVIKSYRYLLSPLIGPRCRFYPSCSRYSIDSIVEHGIFTGFIFTIRRILKCHPWHPGGYDPVPHKKGINHNGL